MTPQEQVLQAAIARIGRAEIAQNRGPIVEECCRPFCSAERFDKLYAAGKMRWCAGFVALCWCAGWPGFARHVSLDVDTLWDNLTAQGWTRRRNAGLPAPADLIFWRRKGTARDLVHVGLVETSGKIVHTIEGNSPTSLGDTGSVGRHSYGIDHATIYGFATIIPR